MNHGECYNVLKIVFWDTLYIFYLILISHVYTSGVLIVTPAIYPHLNKFTGKLQFCYLSQLFQLRISKPLPTNKLIDRQTEITTLYTKKCDLLRLLQNCTFFVQLSCMVFFQYFSKILIFFDISIDLKKKFANFFFSLKIKSSEKQKCVYKLFLSKSNFL